MHTKYPLLLLLLGILFSVRAEVTLPQLISDGMVLQRDVELKIWGWAAPGERVMLQFQKDRLSATADMDGNWQISLPPQPAGGPYEMTIKGQNEILIKDILFGDVWLCAGQSNMVLPMERVKEKYPEEIAQADYPEIRNFFIRTTPKLEGPQPDLPEGEWKWANPEDVLSFSATAYFFARSVYEKYRIPIGLINASVGGTPIEAWISEEGLRTFPDLQKRIEQHKDTAYLNALFASRPAPAPRQSQDMGTKGDIPWYDEQYVAKDWYPINIPGYWEDQGVRDLNGVVWYRRDIELPAAMAGSSAKLFMGRIVDADEVYVNGTKVGNITYQYPPRRYQVPTGLLRAGKNTIVIRVTNYSGKGGFVPDKPYVLVANGQEIDLKGEWQYKVGEVFEPRTGGGPFFSAQNQPAALYNGMVAPVINYRIKGYLWYQGESNTGNPQPYRELLPALIRNWRNLWGQGELPFLYVQLANFQDVDYLPTESNWAELRDAQLKALSVPKTAMAVTIDLGEWNDIHPLDKQGVGERLARGAFRLAYGDQNVVYSGPIYRSSDIRGNRIILHFDHIGSRLISLDGGPLQRFEIAGADRKFVWAEAQIEGDAVAVWHEDIPEPKYVRYAWSDNPRGANLYNKEGLPASPFRTYDPYEENKQVWRGKKCTVVLTYDDALNVHLDNAIPILDSLGFKGTFYLTTYAQAFRNRIADWRTAAGHGHEMGNHTLFHPCIGNLPGRDWVSEDYDMSNYSLRRMLDEVRMTNVVLESLDGQTERTFAFTCGDRTVDGENFIDQMEDDFVAARSVRHEMHQIDQIDLYDVDCYAINGDSGEEMIARVKEAMASNSLLVFLFHGVGGEHSLNVSLQAHRELLEFLAGEQENIWVTTMLEAAKHIREQQAGSN
jgi:sialate O-acetylesterase